MTSIKKVFDNNFKAGVKAGEATNEKMALRSVKEADRGGSFSSKEEAKKSIAKNNKGMSAQRTVRRTTSTGYMPQREFAQVHKKMTGHSLRSEQGSFSPDDPAVKGKSKAQLLKEIMEHDRKLPASQRTKKQ